MIDLIIGPILAQIAPWLAGAAAVVVAILGLRRSGRKEAQAKAAAKADRATIKTVERIQDAQDRASAGGAAWHDRLRSTKPRD